MAIQLPNGRNYFATSTGAPGVGYKLYTYIPGTSTPKDTYTSASGAVANTNPVIADARGEMSIYWIGSYDVVLKDASDNTIWGPERLEETGSANDLEDRLASTSSASVGTGLLGWLRAATGAVATTLYRWLGWQDFDPFEFMTAAQIADVQANTATLDVSAAWQACITAAAGRPIRMRAGSHRINTKLTYNTSGTKPGLKICGDGFHKSVFVTAVANDAMLSVDGSGTSNLFAHDLELVDFSIRVQGATANARGIDIRSQWNGRIKVDVQDLTGDAFRIFNDNSDADSSAYIDFAGSYVKGCEFGFNCPNPSTASSALSYFSFDGVHCVLNRSGGYRLLGAGHAIRNGSVSYNQGAGGLVAPYDALATALKSLTVDNVEFDGNQNYNIDLQAVLQATLSNLKFVYADPTTPNPFPSVRIGDGGVGSALDVVMLNHHHRTDGVATVTAYTFGSNAANISLDNDYYPTTTGITQFAGNIAALTRHGEAGKLTMQGVKTLTSDAASTGTSYTPNMSLAVRHRIVFNGASLVINAPLYPTEGQTLILDLFNAATGITPTFNAVFLHVAPGVVGSSKRRTASFTYSAADAAWVINGAWSPDI